MTKRELIDTGTDKRYVRRDEKGRFDEVFFVDLPDAAARKKILEIHLRRRQRDPNKFALDKLEPLLETLLKIHQLAQPKVGVLE